MEIENIAIEILDKLKLFADDIAVPKYNVSYLELITALIVGKSVAGAAKILNVPDSMLEHRISRHIKVYLPNKPRTSPWGFALLLFVNKQKCITCNTIKSITEFSKSLGNYNGISNICKVCDRTRSIKYAEENPDKVKQIRDSHYQNNKEYYLFKNAKRKATLARASRVDNISEEEYTGMLEFYKNTPEGYHVDHIVPLQNALVCGLHCLANLQYLPAQENLSKSNKFIVE